MVSLPKSKLEVHIINSEDAMWAIKKVEQHLKNFDRLLKEWELKPIMIKTKTYRADIDTL